MKYFLLVALFMFPNLASAESETESLIKAALTSPARDVKDRERDENRLPLETLRFFGLERDMRVMELLAGWGWYTRILAPVLGEEGTLYESLGTTRVQKLLGQEGYESVVHLPLETVIERPEGELLYQLTPFEFPVSELDMVLTFRNYHNFDAQSRHSINVAVYKALKSGGIYGVVDHTRRHMQPMTLENNRRFDPVLAIKEIQAAGFILEDFSDLHYRPDDELRYEVGRKSVTGNTDRFTLKFRKP